VLNEESIFVAHNFNFLAYNNNNEDKRQSRCPFVFQHIKLCICLNKKLAWDRPSKLRI
jgi:hypothetical protein